MGKKKQFAPKDGSTKFVLMHRSQQDAEYGQEGASDLVLYPVGRSGGGVPTPTARPTAAAALASGKDHVNHLGLPNDGYDYEKHMRSIGDGGVFVGKSGKVAQAAVLPAEAMASIKEEHERLLEAITISENCMDADVASALFDADYDNGELDDDFVLQASATDGDEASAEFEGGGGGFDYDAHIAKMLKASEKSMGLVEELSSDGEGSEYSDDGDGSEAGGVAPSVMGSVLGVDGAQRAKIDLEFEKALLEYDSDECGPLEDPDDDPTLQGKLGLDDDDISALMDEFLVVSAKDRILAHGGKGSKPGAALEDEAASAEDAGTGDVAEGAAEEKGPEAGEDSGNDSGIEDYMPDYFKAKEVSQWDCESIISTYSNLDNHPVRIAEPRREPRKKKAAPPASSAEPAVADRELPKRIVLSAKSGMPVGVFPTTQLQDSEGPGADNAPENKGAGRSKEESKEEKRARKTRVKEERQVTRVAKTQTKAAFKQEALDSQALAARGGGGVAVFRY